jgi:hypothetical protein
VVNTNPVYYPFSVVPSTSNSNVFPYDIVINEAYPGLIFDPTEAGGVYSVIREVNGCLWFVLNADYDETSLQWTQEDPTNPNLPAYAMELCATTASWQWKYGAPTLVPGTPITWVNVFTIDDNGSVVSVPHISLASGDPAQQINPTWNAGSASVMVGRNLAVTDMSSSSNSLLDNLAVNGTSVWSVNKFGLLVTGEVPASSVVDLFVNPTFTGTSTFTGPVIMEDGMTVTAGTSIFDGLLVSNDGIDINTGGLGVTGGATTDTLDVLNNATVHGPLDVDGAFTAHGSLDVDGALTAHGPLTADTTLFVAGSSTLNGGLTVTGGESITGSSVIDNLDVTVGLTVGGTSNLHNVVLSSGDTITINGTTPVVSLQSTDSSITIIQTSPVEYDLEVNTGSSSLSYPIGGTKVAYGASGTSLVIPSVGSLWNVISMQNVFLSVNTGGNVVATGTGGTDGGAWAGGTDTLTNPGQNQVTLQLNGLVHAGDTITATTSSTGSVAITTTNMQILATRVS